MQESTIDEARELLEESRINAIHTLQEVMSSGKPSDQLNAAESILNRTGLPQSKTLEITQKPPIDPDILTHILTGIASMFLKKDPNNPDISNKLKDITPIIQEPSEQAKKALISPKKTPGQILPDDPQPVKVPKKYRHIAENAPESTQQPKPDKEPTVDIENVPQDVLESLGD